MSEKLNIPWKVKVFAATSLAIAGAAGVECGSGDKKPEVLGVQATATESFTATVVLEPTKIPEKTVVPTETPEVIVPVKLSDSVEIKAELSAIYKGKVLSKDSCSVDVIKAFVDQSYELYQKNPAKNTLAGQIASVYAELSVIEESSNDKTISDLMKQVRTGIEILLIEHLKERNLPASNITASFEAWNQNVARKVIGIKDGSGCDIVLEAKK